MLERNLCWALTLVLSALLLTVSLQYLLGPTPNAVFGLLAARSGHALFEPDARYLTAGLQLLAVVLLLWPRTRFIGAGLAVAVALAAIVIHLTPWLGINLPNPKATTAALAAGMSAADIDAMHLPTDKGAMFLLALAISVLGMATIFLERAELRVLGLGRKPTPPSAAPKDDVALTRS
jgi:hypothetical protein